MPGSKEGQPFEPHPPTQATVFRRRLAREAFRFVFKGRVIGDLGGVDRAVQLKEEGYGTIVLFNHFSKGDAFRIFGKAIFVRPALTRSVMLGPLAYHQQSRLQGFLNDVLEINARPVVTPDTLKKMPEAESLRRPLLTTYLNDARAVLSTAGVIPISPQAGRRGTLYEEPPSDAIELLLRNAERRGDTKTAFLLVGLGIPGVNDYSDPAITGLNPGQAYDVFLGPTYRLEEARREMSAGERLGSWIFRKLEDIVPPAYRGHPHTGAISIAP